MPFSGIAMVGRVETQANTHGTPAISVINPINISAVAWSGISPEYLNVFAFAMWMPTMDNDVSSSIADVRDILGALAWDGCHFSHRRNSNVHEEMVYDNCSCFNAFKCLGRLYYHIQYSPPGYGAWYKARRVTSTRKKAKKCVCTCHVV